jgi:cell division septation protein DedD
MYLGMEEPLESANNRVKQLTKQIPKDVKANDQTAAATALRHLDIELERVVALFPPGALPADVVSKFQANDSLDADNGAEVVQPSAVAQPQKYVCPMHPEVTATRPGNCPKCGMALEKVRN